MNKLYKYISVLFFLPLLFFSCTREGIKEDRDDVRPGVVIFSLSSSNLRASGLENETRPTPALEREKTINKLYAVVFKSSSGMHYRTIECVKNPSTNTYEFDNEMSGEFYFSLVANPDDELLASLNNVGTITELGMLVAKQTPGEDAQAHNFLMTSTPQLIKIQKEKTTKLSDPIKLSRVAARFDFYNKIEGLEITKITFGKRYTSSRLFAQVKKMDGLSSTNDKVYEGANLFKNQALIATIYGYENDNRSETFFTIEATYKGQPLNPEEIRLENFVIKRNHLYNIILNEIGGNINPDDPKKPFGHLKYDIKVEDWATESDGRRLGLDEDSVAENLVLSDYLSYDAELKNAPYMTPYLKGSQQSIYTTTKDNTEVTFKIRTYVRKGSLELTRESSSLAGVSLTEKGDAIKDPHTGEFVRTYVLTLPKQEQYVSIDTFDEKGRIHMPKFFKVDLTAKNATEAKMRAITVLHGLIRLPLDYITKNPLNKEGNDFAKSPNKISEMGYFNQKYQAIPKFTKCTIQKKNYHLPKDYYELASIFPITFGGKDAVGGGKSIPTRVDNQDEYVILPGHYKYISKGGNAYFKFQMDTKTDKRKRVTYALRLKHKGLQNLYMTAYKYEWVGDFHHVCPNGRTIEDEDDCISKCEQRDVVNSYFKVTCRYLGPNFNGRVDDIATDDFWNNNNNNDVSRKFYAMGTLDWDQENHHNFDEHIGIYAYILSQTIYKEDPSYAEVATLSPGSWNAAALLWANRPNVRETKLVAFPIWLFEDEE